LRNVIIAGTGSYAPVKVLSNQDLEKMVDTTDEWIRTRTGISQRRIAEKALSTSDLAYQAALKAVRNAGMKKEEIDLIIVATITPDMFFPSTACFVQEKLGLKGNIAFDVTAACSGFVYALSTAHNYISSGMAKNALVIGAETLSKVTDWEDRATCVLLGDGAGAVVIKPDEEKEGLLSYSLGADGSSWELLHIPGGGSRTPASAETIEKRLHFIKMKGNELFKIAVRVLVEAAGSALEKAGLSVADLDLLIPHQANLRIIDAVAKRLGLSESQVYTNLQFYGNTSAASIPIALDEASEKGLLKEGDVIVLDAFGGGLTWGACALKWRI
jgi:3-oxoacyl-[acyl-carrier-protein] synthase III